MDITHSLKQRIVIVFALMSALVAGVFAVGVIATVHVVEKRLTIMSLGGNLHRLLTQDRVEDWRHRPEKDELFYADDGVADVAMVDDLKGLRPGFQEFFRGQRSYYAMVESVGGRRYVLLRDQRGFEKRERILFGIVLVGFILSVLLAVLLALNITPGPLLFTQQPDVVWGLIAALFIANFMLLAMNIPMIGLFTRVLLIPPRILMPIVAMVSFVGIYGISGSSFDLLVMVGFGVLGWVLRKLDVPLVPIILGTLLGNAMENNLRRAITISNGDWFTLIDSPLSLTLWSMDIIGFVLPIIFGKVLKARMRHMKKDEEGSVID